MIASDPLITLHVHTIGHHGDIVTVALTAKDAADAFAAEAANAGETDTDGSYGMSIVVPRCALRDAVRFLLASYGSATANTAADTLAA